MAREEGSAVVGKKTAARGVCCSFTRLTSPSQREGGGARGTTLRASGERGALACSLASASAFALLSYYLRVRDRAWDSQAAPRAGGLEGKRRA